MTENFLGEIRKIGSLNRAIVSSVTLYKGKNEVEVKLITDSVFSDEDEAAAKKVVRSFVPEFFSCALKIVKLSPDEDMVAKKIYSLVGETNNRFASLITQNDIKVTRVDGGFDFEISVIDTDAYSSGVIRSVCTKLEKCFCGRFTGKCVRSERTLDQLEVEESRDNIEYEIPIRTFNIDKFSHLEGNDRPNTAVYIADLNFVSENVVICGEILDIRERTVTNSSGKEKSMFNFTVSDGTATVRVGYFTRQKSLDKIKKLKVGDSIVLTCKTELFRESVRATANYIDYGCVPEGFVPEKRASKPVPQHYQTVFPQKYTDYQQDNLFTDLSLPKCLMENTFVVFDLETTGLNSSPSTGNMDRIIEIGAYKIIGGEIKESFNTFIDPCRKLSDEIIGLTGIEQSMVDDAPVYEKVMPDFFKFISGSYLVGHNAVNFDYKFIDYYCSVCGYSPERKLFDTLFISQQTLHLSNYKLNTVADYFGINFNHHRASDDALATAKIFIELIKLKKSLPNPC